MMIERFRDVCHADDRIVAVLMFGSFTTGEGDAFSDIEFAVFVQDEAFDALDQRSLLEAVSPVAAYYPDDYGHHTALFENGVRGEFHFMRASEVSIVASWQGYGWFPSLDSAVMLDRTGELSYYARALVGGPPARDGAGVLESLALNLVGLMLFGANLLNRGEYARAWALLSKAHENLLKMIRLSEGATEHWPTPSRALESDFSEAVYRRYVACTADARPVPLCAAWRASWRWSRELLDAAVSRQNLKLPSTICERIDRLLDEALARSMKHVSERAQ
jgi:lincosamide nucleotidyltransferase